MNMPRFKPPSAADELADCAVCNQRFHYTQLDDHGMCGTCHPQSDTCEKCGGVGEVRNPYLPEPEQSSDWITCPKCQGTGKV